MIKKVLYILVLVVTCSVFGQNFTKHTVAKGETIQLIAQKYKVTPYDIYQLNPDSKNGIQPNSVLLIPKSLQGIAVAKTTTTKNHKVLAKETKYSIAKLYNIEVADLEKANPILATEGLKPEQILVIPTVKPIVKKPETPKEVKTQSPITHEVVAGDTKYSISKKYGVSIEELEKQNPEIKDGLPLGFSLKINGQHTKTVTPTTAVADVSKPKTSDLLEYTVKTGETMYSLTRLFGLSETALTGLNPALKDGVREGMVLKVPANLSFSKETKNSLKNLSQSISSQKKKELVLFLPFNVSKIQGDTITSVTERLKKDKFLNMTLDFYSGALMAIDSAKVLGMNINVKIFDSEETKFSTSALSVISGNNFADTDAVIGPFYQINVEKVASVLETQNIPVISPLSKDSGKSFTNLYQSMPQSEDIRKAMFDYMHSKNGNIIGVIEPKKASLRQYIQEYQKDVKVVGVSEKGGFVADSIKKYFAKDRMNYVVMASEKTGTIFTVTNAMLKALKEYHLQLVILEPNETLDFEEIDLSRLTKLKMAYPSATRNNDTDEAQQFENAYKKKNRIFPNQYAIRGFDVTFDTMLRLSQGKTFEETVNSEATEQIESKFDYAKKISGGYANNGIYILYYDEDLTIKQAQ